MSQLQMKVPPSSLYLSIRGIKYAFHEAIADLVDNSVDAEASCVWIKAEKGEVIIADDGNGMDKESLEVAITPWAAGKKPAKSRRGKRGKFGIGMKSASFSLGDRLEIHTRKPPHAFESITLDRDEISHIDDPGHFFETQNSVTPQFKSYCKDGHGTVLRVTKINRRKVTDQAIDSLRNLLGLVYFQLIGNGELKILINNQEVKPLDPIMRGLAKNKDKNWYKSFKKETIEVKYDDVKATFKIQGAYIGRGNFWTDEDKKTYRYFLKRSHTEEDTLKRGLIKLDEQGIYTLRNGRLITLGGWFGLASVNTLLHHNAPVRVLLEFDESGDELMGLDSTKTQLKVEESLKEHLGSYIRFIVSQGETHFREEGDVLNKLRIRKKASEEVKRLNLRKDSAVAQFKLDERRKKTNPEYEQREIQIEEIQRHEAESSPELVELKESLPFNALWDFKKNKDKEVLLLLNEQHPGYAPLLIEDDESKIHKNIIHFFYTLAMYEATIRELHSELKPAALDEVEKLFKTFRRWVSKHYTEF